MYFCLVPPDIIDSESSTDTIVREGSNVSLTCAASGHPQPNILWRREDGSSITRGKSKCNLIGSEIIFHAVLLILNFLFLFLLATLDHFPGMDSQLF